MHGHTFGEGIMLANLIWLAFFMVHRSEHVCMPKGKVYRVSEEGEKVFYRSPLGIIWKFLR